MQVLLLKHDIVLRVVKLPIIYLLGQKNQAVHQMHLQLHVILPMPLQAQPELHHHHLRHMAQKQSLGMVKM